MDTFGEQRAADDQRRSQQLRRRQPLMQQKRREDHRAQRLQIAAYRHGLDGKRAEGGEVAPAAEAGVDDAQQQYPRPAGGSDGHGEAAFAQQQKKHRNGGRQHLQQGILHTVHAPGLFVEDQHHRVAHGAHDTIEEARCVDLPATQAVYQHDAAADAQESCDLHPGQRLMEQQRRQGHDHHRAAVIQQRCGGYADDPVSGIQEHPAGTHGRAGKTDQQYAALAAREGETMAGQEKKANRLRLPSSVRSRTIWLLSSAMRLATMPLKPNRRRARKKRKRKRCF